MRNLLDFLQRNNHFFVFLLLEALSFALMFRFNSYHGSVCFTAANSAVAKVDGLFQQTAAFLRLSEVNGELTKSNIRLQEENNALRDALADATRDTTLTEHLMREKLAGYDMLPAKVVSNGCGRANDFLVIDRGESDGVRPEMGVVGGGGVVGIVYLTGSHNSLVIPITNRKSSVSCRVRGQGYFGFLQWDGTSRRRATLDEVPRYARVKPGDVVETSGYSAVFPPGIFVGRVRSVGNSSDGQSFKLDVVLGTNFANLRDVAVVTTPYKAEIDTLRSRAEAAQPAE